MFERLKARGAQLRERRAALGEAEARLRQQRQEIAQRAQLARDLLADPRYTAWLKMMDDTREAFLQELQLLGVESVGGGLAFTDESSGELSVKASRLLGRLEVLRLMMQLPETILAIAERGEAARETTGRPTHPERLVPDGEDREPSESSPD